VLADEVRLQHQRLELVVGHDVLEVGDLPDERVGLGIPRSRVLEVRAHAAPQGRRLADVDHLILAVPVEINPRTVGQARELVFEGVTHSDYCSDGACPVRGEGGLV